jgi:hypothetical protein
MVCSGFDLDRNTNYQQKGPQRHMYENGKMRPVETIAGVGRGRIKENDRRNEFNYDVL